MTLYLTNLAKAFHFFYANNQIINTSDPKLSAQRIHLASAVKQVIGNGLKLIGITPVKQM
jgi:arginyl-tRNA synthetase